MAIHPKTKASKTANVKNLTVKRQGGTGFSRAKGKKVTDEKVKQKLGKGGFYHDETYKTVCCWTAETRIKYVPNPKSGKSFFRYAKYEKSKTVGEALAKGSWPLDLLFDYQTGKLSVLGGPVRKEPCMPEEAKTHTDSVFSKWYYRAHPEKLKELRNAQAIFAEKSMGHFNMKNQAKALELSKKFNIKLDEFSEGMMSNLDAARKAADNVAKSIVAKKAKVTDKDVLKILKIWGFHQNDVRLNVLPEGEKWVFSDTLGLIRSRDGRYMVNGITEAFPNVFHLLQKWLRDNTSKKYAKAFPSTSISLNYAYAARIHRDQNNHGPSMGMAVGKFTGGRLQCWEDDRHEISGSEVDRLLQFAPKIVDVAKGPKLFDGCRAHAVEAFKGSRYSLVFFSIGKYWKAPQPATDFLRSYGAELPTKENMKYYMEQMPVPRGYKGFTKVKKIAKAQFQKSSKHKRP
mmetsp:Transcript_6720/g.11563  ORF Transcript_6720/g.11563 Transcript_6720/m.11563 type:complete len:458 (-) Transcript_6720:201-1574(-)